MRRPAALLQAVPDVYARATRTDATVGIDVVRGRAQHAAMVEGLEWLGYRTLVLPPDGAGPDAIFVEDPVVVFGNRACMTRSAHPVRALEGPRLEASLVQMGLELVEMEQGTLDGGDVLIVEGVAYVGLTDRSDRAGAAALAVAFPELEVRVVPMPAEVLHLKCDCSPLGGGQVLCTEALAGVFEGLDRVVVPIGEDYAANCVARGGRVLVSAGFAGTTALLRARGFEVSVLEMDAIRAGDGAMTCLSIRTGA